MEKKKNSPLSLLSIFFRQNLPIPLLGFVLLFDLQGRDLESAIPSPDHFEGSMDLPQESDDYIRESIESSLGLPASPRTLQLKLLASEDERHRLQDQIFLLQDRLHDADRRLDQYKAEASMNAQGLRRCVEDLVAQCAKLEKGCVLSDRKFEKTMDSSDELAEASKNAQGLRKCVEEKELEAAAHADWVAQCTKLEEENRLAKEKLEKIRDYKDELLTVYRAKVDLVLTELKVNISRAEEEVKVLLKENRILNEENKRLLKQASRERHHQGSNNKYSTSTCAKGKRKSSLKEGSPIGRTIDFGGVDTTRPPLSPLHQNSPDSRIHKK